MCVCVYVCVYIYFCQITKKKQNHPICIKASRGEDTSSLFLTHCQQQLHVSGKCLPEQNKFPFNSTSQDKALPGRAGRGMLRAGSVLWHLPVRPREGRGLGGKCFICIPIYSSITHVAKRLQRASLGKEELPSLGPCSWSPSSEAAPRSGHAPRSCQRFIRCWKGPEKSLFP